MTTKCRRGKPPTKTRRGKPLTKKMCITRSISNACDNRYRRIKPIRYYRTTDAFELYEKGMTYTQIGAELGTTERTAQKLVMDNFITRETKITYLPERSIYDLCVAADLSFKAMCRLYAVAAYGEGLETIEDHQRV